MRFPLLLVHLNLDACIFPSSKHHARVNRTNDSASGFAAPAHGLLLVCCCFFAAAAAADADLLLLLGGLLLMLICCCCCCCWFPMLLEKGCAFQSLAKASQSLAKASRERLAPCHCKVKEKNPLSGLLRAALAMLWPFRFYVKNIEKRVI